MVPLTSQLKNTDYFERSLGLICLHFELLILSFSSWEQRSDLNVDNEKT